MPKKFNEIPTEQWSVNHLRDYLYDRHLEILGVKYVARNFAVDTRMLKNFANAHGIAVTKRFIDACLANYSGSAQYPGVNFSFMQTYMKERYLPACLKAEVTLKSVGADRVIETDSEFDADWL
jgi:hypothetical protein